jgi:CheY-like chemotaxis protein
MENKDCALSGMKILIVDDEPEALTVTQLMLVHYQAEVRTASTAAEGLEQVKRERPDVIVSDIGMPQMDGYQFIREVRKLPAVHGGQTPAVALTAFAREQDRAKALDAGFQRHVAKPVDLDVLVNTLAEVKEIRPGHS